MRKVNQKSRPLTALEQRHAQKITHVVFLTKQPTYFLLSYRLLRPLRRRRHPWHLDRPNEPQAQASEWWHQPESQNWSGLGSFVTIFCDQEKAKLPEPLPAPGCPERTSNVVWYCAFWKLNLRSFSMVNWFNFWFTWVWRWLHLGRRIKRCWSDWFWRRHSRALLSPSEKRILWMNSLLAKGLDTNSEFLVYKRPTQSVQIGKNHQNIS